MPGVTGKREMTGQTNTTDQTKNITLEQVSEKLAELEHVGVEEHASVYESMHSLLQFTSEQTDDKS